MSRAINVEIIPKENDTLEQIIKKFNKKMKKSNTLELHRESLRYKKPSERRKEKERKRQFVLKALQLERDKQSKNDTKREN